MKNFYVTPLVEVVELEIEDAVMVGNSGPEGMSQGNSLGSLDEPLSTSLYNKN